MTKTPTIQTLLLLLLALLTACNDPKPVTDALRRAEALMDEHPDSALAVLNTLSPDAMGKERTRAHYALLYTQAQDKNYIDETDDSLITLATDYYRHTDDVRRKFLSHYYKGRVLTNAEDYLNATTCYMEAEQVVDAVDDDYLAGLLYAELGRIYDIYYDYPKSLEAYRKAAECYERAGKIRHRNYMWLNQSDVCRSMNEYEESERLLLQALASGKESADSALVRLSMGTMVMQYVEGKEMRKADSLLRELKPFVNESFGSSSFVARLSQLYLSLGEIDRAEYYLNEGWKRAVSHTDTVGLYVVSAELNSLKGEGIVAYRELTKAVILQNENTQQALQQPVLTVQRDYLSEKLAFETYQVQMEKRLRGLYVLVSVLALAIAIIVFVWIFKKYKKESGQVIRHLEMEKAQVVKEKDSISLKLQRLDEDKQEADRTIESLKEEIVQNEKVSNARIAELLQKLDNDKEESNSSISNLKQKLEQKDEENNRSMASLTEKMVQERSVARQTIHHLNDLIAQKEESRIKMVALIQKLEKESKSNAETITGLRDGLEQMQKDYDVYIRKAENMQDELRGKIHQYSAHAADLFRKVNSDMSELLVVVKEKKVAVPGICKVVYGWKDNYCVGKKALGRLEYLVDYYYDDAMSHFRGEVVLCDEEHYRMVCYWFAGVSIKAVALLMGESKDNVYQRRLRLREKIESSDYLHKQIYLKLLSK